MGHLVMSQVETMEFGLQVCTQSPELLLVRHCDAPREGKRMLNLFKFEHEGEDFVVVIHDFLSEDCRQRGQV